MPCRRDGLERPDYRLGGSHAEGLRDEHAIALRSRNQDTVHVRVEERRPRPRLGLVAANVERSAGRDVERTLDLRRLLRRADDADIESLRARRVERGDVKRREREDQRKAAEDRPDDDPRRAPDRPGGGSGRGIGVAPSVIW